MSEPDSIQPNDDNGETALVQAPPQDVEIIEMKEINPLQWEPVSTDDCFRRCQTLVKSGLFRKFQNPEQAYVVALKGREMGLTYMQSTAMFDVIQGQIALKAQAQIAIIERQGVAEYIFCEEMSDKKATWVTKRNGRKNEQRVTFTIEMADLRGYLAKDNWKKMPETMLMWRSASMLARMAYPDIIMGLYDPDELRDEQDLDPFGSLKLEGAIQATSAALDAPTAHAAPKAKADALLQQLKSGKPTPPKLIEPPKTAPEKVEQKPEEPVKQPAAGAETTPAPVGDGPEEPPVPSEADQPPAETPQTPPAEPQEPTTQAGQEAIKQTGRDELKRIQKELADQVGVEQARAAWYAEPGAVGTIKGLRNLQSINDKVNNARALWRKFELAELIGGHAAIVKESGPATEMPDVEEPWTKTVDELEAMEDAWRNQAEVLGATDSGEMLEEEEAFGPPEDQG